MVEEYCKLSLTKPTDKLPALSGLADQIRNRRGANYIAGLWDDSLLDDLLWQVSIDAYPRAPKLVPWRAPPWSRASVSDRVRYSLNPHLHCTVIDVHCSWAGPSMTGELLTGHIVLRGPTLQGAICNGTFYEDLETQKPVNGQVLPDYQLEFGTMQVLGVANRSRVVGLRVSSRIETNGCKRNKFRACWPT